METVKGKLQPFKATNKFRLLETVLINILKNIFVLENENFLFN